MNVLLINPPRYAGPLNKILPTLYPMGLAYVASYLERNEIDVEIVDLSVEPQGTERDVLKKHLMINLPDLVGITCTTPLSYSAHDIARTCKLLLADVKVAMGGIHPTVMPDQMLADKNVDFVVRGEGEQTMYELVLALNKGKGFDKIMGMSYKKRGTIVHNPHRPFSNNLDGIPFPARHLLPLKKYRKLVRSSELTFQTPGDVVLGARGCPYNCIFCAARAVSGHRYRTRSPKNIIKEMEILINAYGIRQIGFMDDNFIVNKDRTEKLCDEIIRRGMSQDVVWLCETRIDSVNKEILQKMKKAGCRMISFGIESGSQRLLNLIRKGTKIEQIGKTLKLVKEVGIETRGTFMLGLPTETEEETRRTIEFAMKLDLDIAKFSLTTPYPGTELYRRCLEEKSITSFDWTRYSSMTGYSDYNPVYVPLGRNANELKEWQRRAHRKFYLRPKIVKNHLLRIRTFDMMRRYIAIGKVLLGL